MDACHSDGIHWQQPQSFAAIAGDSILDGIYLKIAKMMQSEQQNTLRPSKPQLMEIGNECKNEIPSTLSTSSAAVVDPVHSVRGSDTEDTSSSSSISAPDTKCL